MTAAFQPQPRQRHRHDFGNNNNNDDGDVVDKARRSQRLGLRCQVSAIISQQANSALPESDARLAYAFTMAQAGASTTARRRYRPGRRCL